MRKNTKERILMRTDFKNAVFTRTNGKSRKKNDR